MYDPAPDHEPASPSERAIYFGFFVVVFALFIAEVVHDYTPGKLTALLVFVFWMPLLVLHEAGHAVVAWLLGWHVGQVEIGIGKPLIRFRLGSASVTVRLVPVAGYVTSVPTRLRYPRFENALIYFAGPGVELIVAGGVLLWIGPERMFSISRDYGLIAWQSLALAAASQAIMNLIPYSVHTRDQKHPNDGLGIIVSFLRPVSYYAQMVGQTFDHEQQDWEAHDSADWWKRGR